MLPYDEEPVRPQDAVPIPESAKQVRLRDLARDHELFTPVLVVAFGRLDVNPVAEYATKFPGLAVEVHILPEPWFDGMPDPRLAQLIYTVPREQWVGLRDFIIGIGILNRVQRRMYHVALQEMHLSDSRILTAESPEVPITVFGLDGNREQIGLEVGPLGRLRVVRAKPRAAMQRMAEAFFNEQPIPYDMGLAPEDQI